MLFITYYPGGMLTEQKLLEQWRLGNEEALFSLMIHYYNDLYKYGLKFTADKEFTKDTVNHFFLHVWDNRRKFFQADSVRAYVMVSFKRFLLNQLRKKRVIRERFDTEWVEKSYEEYIILSQKEASIKKALYQAIQCLPSRQKELIRLRFFEQLSYEEIAEKNSLSVRTIYNMLHLAIKNLRSNALIEKVKKNLLFFLF